MQGLLDWTQAPDMQAAILDDVEVFVPCGLHPWERHPERPNRLLVSARLFSTARFEGAGGYIDYDRLRDRILSWAGRDHVDLLETLLQDLVDTAFADPLVEACAVRIVKPDIFGEAKAAGVEWFRRRPT